MHVINIGVGDLDRFIGIEEINNPLDEVNYIITWDDHSKSTFIIAFDPSASRLKIVRPAPYEAYELEDTLCSAVENWANGFYWK